MLDKEQDTVTALRQTLSQMQALAKESARAMPAEFYTSEGFLELEKDKVLRHEWMCIGHAGEVANAGDFYTTELLDEQLIVTRDTDNVIRVLSNVCRHRGNQVAQGSGNCRKFVCSYHTWSYDNAGALVSAPLMKNQPGFDKQKCGLPEFASEIWNGWIFVNLDGTATPLAPRLEGLQAIIKNYHPEERFLNFMEEDVWNCNWKCLFENFMEGYHLSATHLKTLHKITPTRLCKKMETGEGWTGYHAYYNPDYPPRGPFHPDLTEDEQRQSPMYGIYPNLVVGMATNFTLFMCLQPLGVDKVKIRWGVVGLENDPDAQMVKDYVTLCRSFNAEDQEKLEILQKALKTRYYPGGPLAPEDFEGSIWDFTHYMAKHLAS
ncbi:aromatic ring-hydroxylating oxygenase subunit alpha [Granulosicoccus antarcticus]|uniref:Biphenyl 2,3-dioxygenase subunit alpha n=1 Tax=Granulosicoccus antarcticus IMCC3135 TaxID=1192854 RepID=A0A2Z2NWK3_9GAMM|nr:aromatic ring-hydroxylating dioxygenase subunit alpha [Granulosicoccus antarcticus]ASJ75729.1 Biphenyl 2,3-dioxygenase subunit alpha [Granulosicoccus antarcticus IMCC3135]